MTRGVPSGRQTTLQDHVTVAGIGVSLGSLAGLFMVWALAVRNGGLTVKPLRDGPLMVQGPLEIVSGTGRTVSRTTETFLCRCGRSADKPFCDGTHKRIAFTAEGGARAKIPRAF